MNAEKLHVFVVPIVHIVQSKEEIYINTYVQLIRDEIFIVSMHSLAHETTNSQSKTEIAIFNFNKLLKKNRTFELYKYFVITHTRCINLFRM